MKAEEQSRSRRGAVEPDSEGWAWPGGQAPTEDPVKKFLLQV